MQTNKQTISNALPYLLAYPAFLAGHQTIQDALNDHLLSNYLSAFLDEEGLPPAKPDAGTTRQQADQSGFFSPMLSDPLATVCADGTSWLPTYILPTLLELLAQNRDVHRLAFLVAAYGHYLADSYARGTTHATHKTNLQPADWARISSHDPVAFLGISALAPAHLHTYPHFVTMYKSYRGQIAQYGVGLLLRQMAYNRLAMSL